MDKATQEALARIDGYTEETHFIDVAGYDAIKVKHWHKDGECFAATRP